jgi:hypothetical protein
VISFRVAPEREHKSHLDSLYNQTQFAMTLQVLSKDEMYAILSKEPSQRTKHEIVALHRAIHRLNIVSVASCDVHFTFSCVLVVHISPSICDFSL